MATEDASSPVSEHIERSKSVSDSPWLWMGLFLCGACIALILTIPKYSWRQKQIEMQYHARVEARQAQEIFSDDVFQASSPAPSEPSSMLISLRPLQLLLAAGILAASVGFWVSRWRLRGAASQIEHAPLPKTD